MGGVATVRSECFLGKKEVDKMSCVAIKTKQASESYRSFSWLDVIDLRFGYFRQDPLPSEHP